MTKKKSPITPDYSPMPMVNGHRPALSRQVAHFLDWAARNDPYTFYTAQVVAKSVYQYGRTLSPESKETIAVRSVMTRAKDILRDEYNRGFCSQRNVGVRACVDSEDTVKNDLKTKARRKYAIEQSIVETGTKAVKASEFTATPEGRQWKTFHKDLMNSIDVQSTHSILEQANKLLTAGK